MVMQFSFISNFNYYYFIGGMEMECKHKNLTEIKEDFYNLDNELITRVKFDRCNNCGCEFNFRENKLIKLWELIRWIEDGAYVGGEWFKGDRGTMIHYDGKKIIGSIYLHPDEKFEYLEK